MNKISRKPLSIFLLLIQVLLVAGIQGQTGQDVKGILQAPNARGVTVNGTAAQNGMTILSGFELKTGSTEVKVNIPGVGEVILGPRSSAAITFSAAGIDFVLNFGSVWVISETDKQSSLKDPNGQVSRTDDKTRILQYPNDGRQAPVVPPNSGPPISYVTWVLIGAGAAAGVAIPVILSISNTRP